MTRIVLYGDHTLREFIDKNGKPKKVTLLLQKIQEKYGNDKNAIDCVINLLDSDNLILANKLIKTILKND